MRVKEIYMVRGAMKGLVAPHECFSGLETEPANPNGGSFSDKMNR